MSLRSNIRTGLEYGLQQLNNALIIPDDFKSWKTLARLSALYALIGAFTLTGFSPEVSSSLGFFSSIIYWFLHFLVSALIVISVSVATSIAGIPRPWPLVLAVMSLPFLLAVPSLLIETVTEPGDNISVGFWAAYVEEVTDIFHPAISLGTLSVLFATRTAMLTQRLRTSLFERVKSEPLLQSALPNVPHHLEQDLIRLEAQDHYVLIVTAAGQATVHIAFNDAVKALSNHRGMQCHRSHWIRFKHVRRIASSGSSYRAELVNGETVPVSRRRYAEFRQKTSLRA